MIALIDHYSQAPGEKGNNRFIYIANLLCDAGFDVEIITTNFSHIKKATRDIPKSEFDNLKYKYVMLPEPGYPKNVCLQRIYSHHVFGKNLRKYLKRKNNIDAVYISVPSLDVGKVAANYCTKRNFPFFVDIQDVWPEAFELLLPLNNISRYLLLPLKIRADHIYRSATYLFAVSKTYLDRGLRANPQRDGMSVFLGTDLKMFDEAVKSSNLIKPDNEIWIVYVGTLGASYNIDIVIYATKMLMKKGFHNVAFKVLGDGPDINRLKHLAVDTPTEFLGRLAYNDMVGVLSHCDIAVNPIVHGAAQSIINKHGDYAAAGLPVISTQESPEYQNLLRQYSCGITCAVDDVQGVADSIEYLINNKDKRHEMGNNSRRMAEELFDRAVTYNQIVDVVKGKISK